MFVNLQYLRYKCLIKILLKFYLLGEEITKKSFLGVIRTTYLPNFMFLH